jgi:hypothetical protein
LKQATAVEKKYYGKGRWTKKIADRKIARNEEEEEDNGTEDTQKEQKVEQ